MPIEPGAQDRWYVEKAAWNAHLGSWPPCDYTPLLQGACNVTYRQPGTFSLSSPSFPANNFARTATLFQCDDHARCFASASPLLQPQKAVVAQRAGLTAPLAHGDSSLALHRQRGVILRLVLLSCGLVVCVFFLGREVLKNEWCGQVRQHHAWWQHRCAQSGGEPARRQAVAPQVIAFFVYEGGGFGKQIVNPARITVEEKNAVLNGQRPTLQPAMKPCQAFGIRDVVADEIMRHAWLSRRSRVLFTRLWIGTDRLDRGPAHRGVFPAVLRPVHRAAHPSAGACVQRCAQIPDRNAGERPCPCSSPRGWS